MGKRTCICNLCSCGRHRCPHLPTKIYDKTEKPCLLSEYTENYPIYESYLPRNSFKPERSYRKASVPMEGLTTCRRDFGLHKMLPVTFHQPDTYVPSQETMDLLTTYKHDFNYLPTCPVGLIKPRDSKFPNGDKIVQYLPTYKADYLSWNQPRRELLRPPHKYRPESSKFENRTTHQDDYTMKGLVTTVSCKPPAKPKLYNIPLEDLTNYKMSYVPHPVEKRFVKEAEKFIPCDIPFENLTTHKESYRGLLGEPAKSIKPPANFPKHDAPFSNITEVQEKFQAWPTPQRVPKSPVVYVPSEEKMDLLTTVQTHYKHLKGSPAITCRPVPSVKKSKRFESSTTSKDDFKQWAAVNTKPIRPTPHLSLPAEPLDCQTTTKTCFVAHPPIITENYKPAWGGLRRNIPVEGQTTYSISFTPKDLGKCPASYMEPPGYIFEEVDSMGHKIYRSISQTGSRQNSSISICDAEKPGQKELEVSA
ncbi:stabilizer of axonemal microtubules 1 isoform X1 [Mus pahari]|uniref:stabilizer of axonemal microtubules 1 isoform X1 n=2 Tax=Mus pahari TaxID=10093 RepID=UPI000A30A98B|nr:stabilizer of axonemal microtubules 1 isoform X1 [Mus pahari]